MTLYTQSKELLKFRQSTCFDKLFACQHCVFMYIDVVDYTRVNFTVIVRNDNDNTYLSYVVTKLLKQDEHIIVEQPQVLAERSLFSLLLLSNAQAFMQLN